MTIETSKTTEEIFKSELDTHVELSDSLIFNQQRLNNQASQMLIEISKKVEEGQGATELGSEIKEYLSCIRDSFLMNTEVEKVLYHIAKLYELSTKIDLELEIDEKTKKRLGFLVLDHPQVFAIRDGALQKTLSESYKKAEVQMEASVDVGAFIERMKEHNASK